MKAVVGTGYEKDVNKKLGAVCKIIMEIWERHNEKLMNEELDWGKDNLE